LTVAEFASVEEHSEVAFVGVPDSLEARLAHEAGIDFIPVKATGWDRAHPLTFLIATARAFVSLFGCLRLLRRWRADVVIGFGGYVSMPLGLAAVIGGIPLVLHEQNSVPGVTNRFLSRWAQTVCLTYPGSIAGLAHADRALVTGDPVRCEVLVADADAGRAGLGLEAGRPVLLVFGGSRGARHLNQAVVGLFERLSAVKGLQVVHIAGPTEADSVRGAVADAAGGETPSWWRVLEYVDAMGDLLAAADVVVCRSGATTIAELTVLGKPSILVPYPYATDFHQHHNAMPLVEAGAAVLVPDTDLDSAVFGDQVVALLTDSSRRSAMAAASASLGRPTAARAVVEAAVEAAAAGSPWRFRKTKASAAPVTGQDEAAPDAPGKEVRS
jgi:UDP-N-acetylglucosamine--N-acetylmuramyl-(pentapeptide) pyrophosphoryl-undecaprenol N-acetylglucosamine transferase